MALFRRDPAPTLLEVRAPDAATRALRYTTPGLPQPPDWDATAAFRIANGVVLTCTRLVGQYLAKCPFRVGADPDQPDSFDPAHPLARLLGPPPGGPNPDTSARRLWAWTIGQRLMAGRWAWEIEPDPQGRPIALYALPVSALTPIPSSSGANYFDGYQYGTGANIRRLTRDQVVYDWQPHPEDWRQPDPPLRAAHLDTLIAVMQSRYDYAFLKNDARPAQLVVTEQFAESDEFEAFKRQWNASYGGPDNAGRTAFAESSGGAKDSVNVVTLGLTARDAQMAERYQYRLQQIALALGVPWSILDASGRTFDNASQEWKNFVAGTLEPLARDLADAVNMQLAPRFGTNVGWFDLRPLGVDDRTNPVTASVGAPSMVQAQLMTINEARADYGLGPVADGDRMMTVDEIAALRGQGAPVLARAVATETGRMPAHDSQQSLASPRLAVRDAGDIAPDAVCKFWTIPYPLVVDADGQPVPPAPGIGAVPVAPPVMMTAERRAELARRAAPETMAVPVDDAQARRVKLWNAKDAQVRTLEKDFERRMARLFRRQQRAVLARLEGKRGRQFLARQETRALADEVYDPAHWIVETADETSVLYRHIFETVADDLALRLGVDFDLASELADEFVSGRANQLAGSVVDTTYRQIQQAMVDGIANGDGIPEIAARIKDVFDTASTTRAVTIARTEVISAYNGSTVAVGTGYGPDVVSGQEWLATQDARTRESHAAIDGQQVPIGAMFDNGLAYPGDPGGDPAEVVNCRCTTILLTPDEYTATRSVQVPARLARAALTAAIDADDAAVAARVLAEAIR